MKHKLVQLVWAILLLVLIASSCSRARKIAQKAEQANSYKKYASQQLQELSIQAQTQTKGWQQLSGGQAITAYLDTNKGTIELRLAFQLAPLAVATFLYLAGDSIIHNQVESYIGANFILPKGFKNSNSENIAYVQAGNPFAMPLFPAEFSEWLHFRKPGVLAFTAVSVENAMNTVNIVSQPSFFISLAANPHLFGKFSAFGQVVKGFHVVRNLQTDDQILSIKVHSDNNLGQEFLARLRRDGLNMLQQLRTEVLYKRQGMAAIHQQLGRDFIEVQWPRYQQQKLQQPKTEYKDSALNQSQQAIAIALQTKMRDWGLEYKVLQAGSTATKLVTKLDDQSNDRLEHELPDSSLVQVEIQYAVWATQNDGRSLLLEDRIQQQRSVRVSLGQLFPAWKVALLDMTPGEKRLYLLPPEGAYGIQGKQPEIPPWSYLVMELYLERVIDF